MKSIIHTKSFKMNVPVADLFPLFSPEGEKQWVPGWDYENVMGHTELSEDYVFLTKTHDHGTADAIWIVKQLLNHQRNEITEHHIYHRLARLQKSPENRRILEDTAEDEKRHYEHWKRYTGEDVPVDWIKVL